MTTNPSMRKMLLTAGGVTNPSIRGALVDLLGKPVEESSALCVPTADQVAAHHVALEAARSRGDFAARDWDASILNNLGMVHAEAGDHAAALAAFEEALEARIRIGDVARIRVARWMVAWSLRRLGHREEALALQKALRTDLAADGQVDPHVEEEIALLEGS